MNQNISVGRGMNRSGAVAMILSLLLVFGQVGNLAVQAQGRQTTKKAALTGDQRVAHVLSRLTFGARPGDFERVKAIGVNEFIRQQLDSDSLDDIAVQARLRKLPTLGMATPVIFEQYTPPKPAASPSPAPAKSPDNSTTGSPKLVAQNSPSQTPQIAGSTNSSFMQTDMQMASKKEDAGRMPALPESMEASEAMPKPAEMQTNVKKEDAGMMSSTPSGLPAWGPRPALPAPTPTPTPKNPQMVVTELQRAALLRAVYSERQLYELMVGFWENHFSIFANKDDDRYLLTSYDRDTIRPFAMGRFRDLLGATAHSPAMLFYLDNWRSSVARPYPATKDKPAGVDGGLNENYARELMELHTLGVDGGYTQKDVQEVARCFSGWTIQKPNEEGLFLYRPGLHDNGEKIVLGHKIPSGGGIGDAERLLDILATHPATARFVATKLARRFISDDPPPSVIDRAAAVFLKTDGSIRETLRAIVTSPEFFSTAAYRAKMRSPFEYVAAAMRALNADTDGDRPVLDAIGRMGQPVFGRITPDGYADRADQWLSSGAMVARFNFANALATNRIKGTKIDVPQLLSGVDQANKDTVATHLILLTVFGDVSSGTRTALEKTARSESAVAPAPSPAANVSVGYSGSGPPPASAPVSPYISELITFLIGSPEFQQR
ncbi:MAG TPA: DUF1800 domain-containing protein [Pyrinomonadaceae bacterium]|nr:DUF1800 domain-containing protein [Pyrinomonadaceae bacterium]